MKKALKVTLGTVLAASALTPVAAFAAETPVAKTGIYDLQTGEFVGKAEFKALTKAEKKAWLLNSNAYLASGGSVYAASAILLPSDQLLEAAVTQDAFQEDKNVTLTPEGTVLDKDGNIVGEDAPTTDLKVESVSAINANQISVTFNKEVEKQSAENLGNYLLEGKIVTNGTSSNVNHTLSTSGTFTQTPKASLQADGKTVLITLDTTDTTNVQVLEGQAKQKLTVENVKDKTGEAVTKAAKEFTHVDTSIPTVESVKTEGNRVVVVKFSEFVTGTAVNPVNYQIDGVSLTAYGAGSGTYNAETNEVRFTLSSALADKTYEFKYSVDNAIQDAANFKVLEGTTDLVISADKTPAKVTDVEVVKPATGSNYILVKFSKPLAQTSNFVTGNPVVLDGTPYGSGTVTVENGALKITAGTGNGAHAINVLNNASNYLVDAYGEKVEAGSITYSVEADLVKPTVTSTKVLDGNNKVEVKFSKRVASISAENRLNYAIKNANGANQTITGAAFKTGTDDTVILTLSSPLVAGQHTIDVKNIQDLATPPNTMTDYTRTLTAVDTIKPDVSTVTHAGTSVYVTYSEDMNTSTITNAANYLFDDKALPTDAKITAISNTVAKIEFASGTVVNGKKLAISTGVTDVAGNALSGFGYETTISAPFDTKSLDVDTTASGTAKVNATDKKTVTVTLNKALELLNAGEFEYTINNGGSWTAFTQQDASFVTNNGKSTITFTLPVTDAQVLNNTSATDIKIRTKVAANATSTTKATDGSVLASDKDGVLFDSGSAQAIQPNDKVAPEVFITNNAAPKQYDVVARDTDANGKIDQLQITFTEALKAGSVSIDDFDVNGLTVADVAVASDVVTLTLNEGAVSDTTDTYTVTLKGNIEDTQGNVLKADTAKAYKANTVLAATVNPTLPAGQFVQEGEGTVTLNNAGTATDKTYTSSNPAAATVDNTGKVTPVAAGATTITYVGKDASGAIVEQGSVDVTVHGTATTVNPTYAQILQVGETTTANVGSGLSAADKAFTSGDSAVATVNATTGEVTALTAGTSTITYVGKDADGKVIEKGQVTVTVHAAANTVNPNYAPVTTLGGAITPTGMDPQATDMTFTINPTGTTDTGATIDADTGALTASTTGDIVVDYVGKDADGKVIERGTTTVTVAS